MSGVVIVDKYQGDLIRPYDFLLLFIHYISLHVIRATVVLTLSYVLVFIPPQELLLIQCLLGLCLRNVGMDLALIRV